MTAGQSPLFRFAPSPNGLLHLGHAFSALINQSRANAINGRLLLRIEDIDLIRCTPEYEEAIYRDLAWLGVHWEAPVRRQSEHFNDYATALERLTQMGVVYPAFMTRGQVKARVNAHEIAGQIWPRDPDGSPVYPADDKLRTKAERDQLLRQGMQYALRLDMPKAMACLHRPLTWRETGDGGERNIQANPVAWGDVVLARSDAPSSYHVSVVVDDAIQNITHIVRGHDLYHATSVHRLLQELLGFPEPIYHHHRLILGTDGRKLSKSERSTGLAALREAGASSADIRRRIGL